MKREVTMARVKLLELDDVEPIAKAAYERSLKDTGRVINLFKVLSHDQKIYRDWNRLGTTLLRKGEFSPRLRELAIVRVGEIDQAEYELTAHRAIGMQVGLTQEQIDNILNWKEASCFDDEEKAVLQYTDEVAAAKDVDDATFDALRKFLSEREVVELTVSIGFYGMVCRTLKALRVDMEK